MNIIERESFTTALEDFRQLRRKAALEELLATLSGASNRLLAFDEIRDQLRAVPSGGKQLQDIPLTAIVGSVGRYGDFTRSFLPRNDKDSERWARVAAAADLHGLPPIEVYQLGEAYFVLDGNHRVSVARNSGASHIHAYVTPFQSRVRFSPDMTAEQLIVVAEAALFLDETSLNETRPAADLSVTAAGQYAALLEHIQVHRYYMGLEQQREISLSEAATHWYDTLYTPLATLINERGLLHDFPGRTVTDLYLFLTAHRAELAAELGWEISEEQAARSLTSQAGNRLGRAMNGLLDAVLPDELEPGPPVGQWRRDQPLAHRNDRLVEAMLVPLNGAAAGWEALDQALMIARREGGRIYGLHVVRNNAVKERPAVTALREEFERRCAAAAVSGQLAIEVGAVARTIVERSRWVDLVVMRVTYPPGPHPLARLKSGLRTLIRRSIRPILAVPRAVASFERPLLAYDGSPKAEEALYLATYLAGRFNQTLQVVSVDGGGVSAATHLARAAAYLAQHGVTAELIHEANANHPAQAILQTAERLGSELIIMGGYGSNPVQDLVLGSTVEEILRASRFPTLILN